MVQEDGLICRVTLYPDRILQTEQIGFCTETHDELGETDACDYEATCINLETLVYALRVPHPRLKV